MMAHDVPPANERTRRLSVAAAMLCVLLLRGQAAPAQLRASGHQATARLRHDIDSLLAQIGHPAAVVVRDIRGDSVIARASGGSRGGEQDDMSGLTTTTPIRPLSVVKLLTAAIWLDRLGTTGHFTCRGEPEGAESVADVVANGCDGAGKDMAIQLRRRIGTPVVLGDLARLGFPQRSSTRILPPNTGDGVRISAHSSADADHLVSSGSFTTLSNMVDDSTWGAALSVGEADFATTLLDLSVFLQAVGNDGMLKGTRVLRTKAARAIQRALLQAVRDGTARGIRDALAGTGWAIGGKTGTGPGANGSKSGGLFASVVFDRAGRARYGIVVLTEAAGPGGGVAARAAADIAKLLVRLRDNRSDALGEYFSKRSLEQRRQLSE